jgi:hypothetical protein
MRWGIGPQPPRRKIMDHMSLELAFIASLFPSLSSEKRLAIYNLFEAQDFDEDDDGSVSYKNAILAPVRDLTLDDLAEIFGNEITVDVPVEVRGDLDGDEEYNGSYNVELDGEELTWSDAYGGRECHTFSFATKKWTSKRLENRTGCTRAAHRKICGQRGCSITYDERELSSVVLACSRSFVR